MKNNNELKGLMFIIFATLSHGLYGIFSRIIGIEFGQIFQIVARSSILLIFFVILTQFKKDWKKINPKDYKWFVLMIFPGLIALASMFTAFNYLSLGTVLFTYYAVSTLGSYVLGYLLFCEKLTKLKIISLILSLVGLYIIFLDSFKLENTQYLLLACLAGLGASAWNVVSKKISDKYSVNQILIMDSLLMIIVGLPVAILLNEKITLPSLSLPWLGILGYSIAAIGSSIFTIKGFKYLQAQIGSLVMLLEPIFGAFVGWLLYKEMLSVNFIFGAILILVGIALPNLKRS
ncbi:MAG TPA: DMT family transporter [Patescibacteria group bacterium]|nr:DMT family transporter [Patescibacteria group bacterium]